MLIFAGLAMIGLGLFPARGIYRLLLLRRILAYVIWFRFCPTKWASGDGLGHLLWVDEHLHITPCTETGE